MARKPYVFSFLNPLPPLIYLPTSELKALVKFREYVKACFKDYSHSIAADVYAFNEATLRLLRQFVKRFILQAAR